MSITVLVALLTCVYRHLEGASGVLGMVKAILMIKNGVILPTAGFESMNPRIQGKDKLVVPATPVPWPAGEPRRVLVTNFGRNTYFPSHLCRGSLLDTHTDLEG